MSRSRLALAMAFSLAVLGAAFSAPTTALAETPATGATATTATTVTVDSGVSGYRLANYQWKSREQVNVFHTWDLACATLPQAGAVSPAAAPVDAATMTGMLRAAIADINGALGDALVLVDAGQAPAGEQCNQRRSNNPYDIVVGWAPLPHGAGLASTTSSDGSIISSRVFVDSLTSWACPTAPQYRDIQQTIAHELLHALGVDHSGDATAVMSASFTFCHAPITLQADDRAALAAVYPSSTPAPVVAPAPAATPVPAAPAPSASAPSTDTGAPSGARIGLAVTPAASTAGDLIATLGGEGCTASSVSVTVNGRWATFVVGAPAFANATFPASIAASTPYFYACR